jgi:hypothetical protein
MYFDMKSYLKSTRNHTAKHAHSMDERERERERELTRVTWKQNSSGK